MVTDRPLPGWAILPAAVKLLASSLRHPNTGKAIYVDFDSRKVTVRSVPDWTTRSGMPVDLFSKEPRA